jgi:hypothetical protein
MVASLERDFPSFSGNQVGGDPAVWMPRKEKKDAIRDGGIVVQIIRW